MFRQGLEAGCLAMLIIFNVGQVLPICPVEVIEAGHTPRAKLTDGVQSTLGIIQGVVQALDICSYVVRSASDQLGLECQPVHAHLRGARLILLVLLHDDLSWAQPSNLYQVGLFGIAPEPNLLPQAVLSIDTLVLETQCTAKATISVSIDQCLLGCLPFGKGILKGEVAAKVRRLGVL